MRDELSSRQRAILRYIVQEYVRTGRAVGSKTLIERYGLDVSPATVRNEMGELEEMNLLQHPHTSAGRLPTDRGYRYYVEYLLDDPHLPIAEQIVIRHQFRQVEQQIDAWAKLAAAILAQASGNVSLVTPPRAVVERLRHFELISLRDHVVLLIAVTQSGAVHESILRLAEPIEQGELSTLSQRLNVEVKDLAHAQIMAKAEGAGGLPGVVLRQLAEALRLMEQQAQSEVFSEGLDLALRQPEFAQATVAQRLLELLRGGAILSALVPQLDFAQDVQVFIGSENRAAELRPFGVVVGMYGANDEINGILGVVGPTRMPYGRSISMVRYLADVLSDLLRVLYEGRPATVTEPEWKDASDDGRAGTTARR